MSELHRFSTEKLFEQLKDACLKETMFWTKQRHTYASTEDTDLVKALERDEFCEYLREICERADMSLGLDTFALAVALLDRFLSSFKVRSKYLECLAVACLYVACKVKEDDEKIAVASEFLVECASKCSVGELLRMELMILAKFEWTVNDITAADFLYMFHALAVNKLGELQGSGGGASKNATKGKMVVKRRVKLQQQKEYARVPDLIDFWPVLEYKLKQVHFFFCIFFYFSFSFFVRYIICYASINDRATRDHMQY